MPLVLLLAGLGLGAVVALQVVDRIRDSRHAGMFAPPAAVAVEAAPAKRTEEDRLLAHALAAAIGARRIEDCRSLAPEHRQECRSYVERWNAEPPIGPPTRR